MVFLLVSAILISVVVLYNYDFIFFFHLEITVDNNIDKDEEINMTMETGKK